MAGNRQGGEFFWSFWVLRQVAGFAVVAMACSAGQQPAAPAAERIVPAINEVDLWQPLGQPPYELTWADRQENPHTLVAFEDLSGWRLELYNQAKGELRRTREQQMWGQYVAGITYSGAGPQSRMVARPPRPIPIPGRFDSVELWGYGNRWEGSRAPRAEVAVLLTDARGAEFRVMMADIRWKSWWLIHRKIPADVRTRMSGAVSFAGLELANLANPDPRVFFCDSLAFYTEELEPLHFRAQPKRNLKPYRGQIVGLNTGSGTLPFPTREETILPENFERDFQVTVRQTAPNGFEFRYQGRDATVVYSYNPQRGVWSELSASIDGGPAFRPLDGGGVRFSDTPAGRVSEGQLIAAGLEDGTLRARFRHGTRIVEYELRLWQKSLVLDVRCEGGQAVEFSFGRVAGVSAPRLITIPYLTYGYTNPRVLMSGSPSKPVFTSIWFDWYRSNGSEPYFLQTPKTTADTAEINGGVRYLPKTDGSRNDLYERIFITSSPVYEETLPTIANPASLRQEEGKQVLWTVAFPRSFAQDHERCRLIRSYGIDKIMQHSHAATWHDGGGSFTLRDRAAPQKGGDAAYRQYVQQQNEMGWLQGAYTNYCDVDPTNTNWSPDHVQRMPDGEWRRAFAQNYALKPAKAVEFDEYYSRRLKEKFGLKMSYTDAHSAIPPWRYCDYDARVPGAGTLAATFYAYGQLLLNDQRVYGPTQSEATYQWLYAGLASGHYGWVYTDVNLLTHPLDVAFMLRKIHPLECDYGMGYTFYYLSKLDQNWTTSPLRREYVDLFLASTIAYGNMGWLVNEFDITTPFGVEAMARSYYMMQQLQQQYAFVRPRTIEYADAQGRFLTPSQAHATGAIRESRLHVTYENGTHVYVNRSSGVWTVHGPDGEAVELPVSGWLAFNARNGFYEISALIEDRRIDYVKAPEYEFLDGRGHWTERGGLGAAGSVARRENAGGTVELIDMYGNDRIRFRTTHRGALVTYDASGKQLGTVALTSPRAGWSEFSPVNGRRRYVFSPAD